MIERSQQADILTLRTYTFGAIHIVTDGKKLSVSCFPTGAEIAAQVESMKPQPPNEEQADQQQ